MTVTDEDLVAALKRGELAAFRQLFDRHGDAMLRIAMGILGNRADAEDAVQEAFGTLFAKAGEFRGESAFFTWFYRIVVNASLMISRRRPRTETLETTEIPLPAPPASPSSEEREALDREIGRLPLQQRLVFTMSDVEGLGREEVAEVLGLAPGTVRYHLFKARETLRRSLAPILEGRRLVRIEDATKGPMKP